MKNKITLLIIIFVFILLIGGSYVLYNYLSPNISSDKITTNEESQKENDASQQERNLPLILRCTTKTIKKLIFQISAANLRLLIFGQAGVDLVKWRCQILKKNTVPSVMRSIF